MPWFVGLGFLCVTCKNANKPATTDAQLSEPVLFTVQDEPTTIKEFLYVYNKNNLNRDSVDLTADLKEYLELYVNFKLKVQEAKEEGLHQQQAFLDELGGYKKQLAGPYLTEKAVTEKLIREAYERLGTEVNASHILIGLKPNPLPADTVAAYSKIMQLRERALAGEDFHALARQHSEDPSASMNGGNLGYFTALQMVYPFENAAYGTPVGSVSKPVRTRFGYHILKVHNKRPSQGKVKVAHIMIRSEENGSEEQAEAAQKKVQDIHKRLKEGGDWQQLAMQFSEDRATKSKGGELDWFSTGNLVPEFEEVAFALKQKGQISEPVRTPYGWHIIKLIEKQSLPSLEEMREELENRVSRDSRAQLQEKVLMERLRRENNFQENKDVVQELMSGADSTLLPGRLKYKQDSLETAKVLFRINEKPYSVSDFKTWLSSNSGKKQNADPKQYLRAQYDRWLSEELLAYEEAHLEDKYDDYRMLVKEYHDGILLFQLMDEKVWTKALEDTAGLRNYFQNNRDKYQWEERIEGVLFSATNAELLQEVEEALSKTPYVLTQGNLGQINVEQEAALPGNIVRTLDKLVGTLRQDSTAVLEVYLPQKQRAAVAPLVERHLEAQALTKERYKILPATKDKEGSVRVLTLSPKALERQFNQKSSLALQVIEGPFERGTHPVVDDISWNPGTYKVQQDGRAYLVKVDKVLPPAPKALNDIRGQVISDYQQYLEQQWIEGLRQKYEVKINQELLDKTLSRLNE